MSSRFRALCGSFRWVPALFLTAIMATSVRAGEAPRQELNVNLFRSPSIGLEYVRAGISLHMGLYPTIISKDENGKNETTWFFKVGAGVFFLPMVLGGASDNPSSFFLSVAYMRGLNNGWKNGYFTELGYRWFVWRGLNLRLGGAYLFSEDHDPKLNPTPGIGWSFPL